MTEKKPQRRLSYVGPLTVAEAAAGIAAALKNARALVEDAELLMRNQRWSRACSLAILAIEEAGKVSLLRGLLLLDTEKEIKDAWKDYRSHTKKNFMGGFLDHLTTNPHIEDFRGLFDPNAEHPHVLDALKQLGFYSDCVGAGNWTIPCTAIDEATASRVLSIARLATPSHEMAMTTAEELEIWVKYVKPARRAGIFAMKEAFLRCFSEAKSRGVLRGEHDMEDVARFLL